MNWVAGAWRAKALVASCMGKLCWHVGLHCCGAVSSAARGMGCRLPPELAASSVLLHLCLCRMGANEAAGQHSSVSRTKLTTWVRHLFSTLSCCWGSEHTQHSLMWCRHLPMDPLC